MFGNAWILLKNIFHRFLTIFYPSPSHSKIFLCSFLFFGPPFHPPPLLLHLCLCVSFNILGSVGSPISTISRFPTFCCLLSQYQFNGVHFRRSRNWKKRARRRARLYQNYFAQKIPEVLLILSQKSTEMTQKLKSYMFANIFENLQFTNSTGSLSVFFQTSWNLNFRNPRVNTL